MGTSFLRLSSKIYYPQANFLMHNLYCIEFHVLQAFHDSCHKTSIVFLLFLGLIDMKMKGNKIDRKRNNMRKRPEAVGFSSGFSREK